MSEWANPSQRIHCVVEMDKPLTVRRERWTLVQGDENANTIVAEVFQTAGKPFDLTGCTVTLTFVRPDHLAAPPITAEVNGNVAAATLTDACYRVSGRYNALMQIKMDGVDRTILWLVGDVLANENDGMVDEEGVFPTPEEMLIIFQQVEQAKKDATTAASEANTASNNANNAATNANAAANNANKWATAETTATAISAESQPTVDVSEKDGKKLISFGIPAGKTPNITFRVSTGEPGTQVEITQRGTPEAPVVELTIPRGDTGAIEGIDYYAGTPSKLGTASTGMANGVARGDHVHPMPSASDVGALPSGGTAANANKLDDKSIADIVLMHYPIGSIYISTNETSPASLFGGTWERLKDRFLLGAGDSYAAGSTGGEAKHVLTINEMPAHSHGYYFPGKDDGTEWYGANGTAKGTLNYSETNGGTAAHNNMPPYLTVYMWKRVG